jgi:hypothetical protein
MEHIQSVELGLTLTEVVHLAWTRGFTTKSTYARTHGIAVACAASLGYITTHEGMGRYGSTWHVTTSGIKYLEQH